MTEVIRPANPGDEAELTAMIHELAEFERASADCIVTETQLREALFGEHAWFDEHDAYPRSGDLHAQRIGAPPLKVLAAIPGMTLVPLEGSEYCCGAAGIYNLLEPEVAADVAAFVASQIADAVSGIPQPVSGCGIAVVGGTCESI